VQETENTTTDSTDAQAEETTSMGEEISDSPAADQASSSADKEKVEVRASQFTPIDTGNGVFQREGNIGRLIDLELPIAVELGRVKMLVKDILELGPGAVVELNKFSGEPVDIFVNSKKFAEGEVVVIDQNFGVRILALVGADERLGNLQ